MNMFTFLCSLVFNALSLNLLPHKDASPDWSWQTYYCHVTKYAASELINFECLGKYEKIGRSMILKY